jgi:acyl dehydratase
MLPEKVAQLIGKKSDIYMMEVERGGIKKYADAIGDRNPLYWNEDLAQNSRYGGMVAPPGFYGWRMRWDETLPLFTPFREELKTTMIEAGFKQLLDGGQEFDFIHPVYAGDILASVQEVISIIEREGKSGIMLVSVVETSYINQNGTLVAKVRQTVIHR